MKSIRNMKELRDEKKRLKHRQEELQKLFRKDWGELKTSLRPGSMARSAVGSFLRKKGAGPGNGSSILESAVAFGAGFMARRLIIKATQKVSKFFNKN